MFLFYFKKHWSRLSCVIRTLCGTPNYIAPEVLNKKGHSYEVDVWSLGCILYTLLIGKPPFETSCLKDTYAKIKKNEFSIPPNKVSVQAKNLIHSLLQPDPNSRPTMAHILEDEFFTCGNQMTAYIFFVCNKIKLVVNLRILSDQTADHLLIDAASIRQRSAQFNASVDESPESDHVERHVRQRHGVLERPQYKSQSNSQWPQRQHQWRNRERCFTS